MTGKDAVMLDHSSGLHFVKCQYSGSKLPHHPGIATLVCGELAMTGETRRVDSRFRGNDSLGCSPCYWYFREQSGRKRRAGRNACP
ncbi:MAG: hypothetical protein FJ012_10805 [Chloroflexi bacterium]|nr:hypothetical protein [Chloroflexota bacterium]